MFPTNSEGLIGISDAFSAFVYGYPSSCPRAQCTPNKSVTTLRYARRHGPVYTGHACMHLPSAVPWISEDRLFGMVYPWECGAGGQNVDDESENTKCTRLETGCLNCVRSGCEITRSGENGPDCSLGKWTLAVLVSTSWGIVK